MKGGEVFKGLAVLGMIGAFLARNADSCAKVASKGDDALRLARHADESRYLLNKGPRLADPASLPIPADHDALLLLGRVGGRVAAHVSRQGAAGEGTEIHASLPEGVALPNSPAEVEAFCAAIRCPADDKAPDHDLRSPATEPDAGASAADAGERRPYADHRANCICDLQQASIVPAYLFKEGRLVMYGGLSDSFGSGELTGLWTRLDEEGRIQSVGGRRHSERHGPWTFYSKKGDVEGTGFFYQDMRVGPWIYYNAAGEEARHFYRNGRPQGEGELFLGGQKISCSSEKSGDGINRLCRYADGKRASESRWPLRSKDGPDERSCFEPNGDKRDCMSQR